MDQVKPNIALIATLGEQGGVQQFLLGFAEHLQKNGCPTSFATGDGRWVGEQAATTNLPYHQFKHLGRAIHPLRDLLALLELTHWLKAEKPDAVHLNSAKAGIIGSIAARLAGVPRIVYRIGGWTFLEPMPAWQRWLYITLERLTARLKDVIICVHEADVEVARVSHIQPREKLICVPNGIDAEALHRELLDRNTARAALGIPGDAFVFGTIANFYPAKNLPAYLESCTEVCRQYPAAKIVFVGDGPERYKIEQAIRDHHLEKNVVLTGQLERASRYLNAFNVFVLPSVKEGMSWSLLEAAAAGIPCIATRVGTAVQTLGEGPWLVEPNDRAALSHALLAAASPSRDTQYSIPDTRLPTLSSTYAGNLSALISPTSSALGRSQPDHSASA